MFLITKPLNMKLLLSSALGMEKGIFSMGNKKQKYTSLNVLVFLQSLLMIAFQQYYLSKPVNIFLFFRICVNVTRCYFSKR